MTEHGVLAPAGSEPHGVNCREEARKTKPLHPSGDGERERHGHRNGRGLLSITSFLPQVCMTAQTLTFSHSSKFLSGFLYIPQCIPPFPPSSSIHVLVQASKESKHREQNARSIDPKIMFLPKQKKRRTAATAVRHKNVKKTRTRFSTRQRLSCQPTRQNKASQPYPHPRRHRPQEVGDSLVPYEQSYSGKGYYYYSSGHPAAPSQ